MIRWSEEFVIGVEEIDKQHKEFFDKANELLENLRRGNQEIRKQSIDSLIDFIKGYLTNHIKDEEELQKKIKYPEYKFHKEAHDDFMERINGIILDLDEEKKEFKTILNLHNIILNWFSEHIIHMDQEIKDYIDA